MKKVLSSADVTKLRRTMADVDKLRGQIRTLHDRNKSSKRAGAHYVVKTPSGGIPASIGDQPGSADCTIHIRDGDPKELRDTTRAETVYNFGPAIPGDTILIAHRDAWGDLWAGEPSSGGVCEDLGDLQPGSYPATAVEAILGGDAGLVVHDGNTYEAVNQSGCDVAIGDKVGLHISPTCQAFFVPCVCCSPPPDPDPTCADEYPCCREPFVFCLRIPFMDTPTIPKTYFGTASLKDTAWTIPGPLESPFTIVCDGEQLFLSFSMTCCEEGTPSVEWEASNLAEEIVASGSFSVAGLCEEPPTIERHTLLLPNGCSMFISFATDFVEDLCGNPEPPPEDCCDQSRWFCLNGVSQELAFDGGTYTWDVSACCETTASFKITMSCNPETGIPTMGWEYTAGVVFDSGNINVVELCDDTSPKIYTFPGITCFLQIIVSFVEFECAECIGGGTTTTAPPPPGP